MAGLWLRLGKRRGCAACLQARPARPGSTCVSLAQGLGPGWRLPGGESCCLTGTHLRHPSLPRRPLSHPALAQLPQEDRRQGRGSSLPLCVTQGLKSPLFYEP